MERTRWGLALLMCLGAGCVDIPPFPDHLFSDVTASVDAADAWTPAPCVSDDAPCDDGAWCTVEDTCKGGVCVGLARDCAGADAPPCLVGQCDESEDACEPTAVASASCDDGDLCTVGDACAFGACEPGVPVDCDDLTEGCVVGLCDGLTGTCVSATPSLPCDDGDPCTEEDTCEEGVCGGAFACDDGDPCTADSCLAGDGACGHVPHEDGTACETPDGCVFGACAAGVCEGLMKLQVQELWTADIFTDGEVVGARLVQGPDGSAGGAVWITDATTVCHVVDGEASLSPVAQAGDRVHLFGHRPDGALAGTGRMETAVIGHLPWVVMEADGGLVLSDVFSAPTTVTIGPDAFIAPASTDVTPVGFAVATGADWSLPWAVSLEGMLTPVAGAPGDAPQLLAAHGGGTLRDRDGASLLTLEVAEDAAGAPLLTLSWLRAGPGFSVPGQDAIGQGGFVTGESLHARLTPAHGDLVVSLKLAGTFGWTGALEPIEPPARLVLRIPDADPAPATNLVVAPASDLAAAPTTELTAGGDHVGVLIGTSDPVTLSSDAGSQLLAPQGADPVRILVAQDDAGEVTTLGWVTGAAATDGANLLASDLEGWLLAAVDAAQIAGETGGAWGAAPGLWAALLADEGALVAVAPLGSAAPVGLAVGAAGRVILAEEALWDPAPGCGLGEGAGLQLRALALALPAGCGLP